MAGRERSLPATLLFMMNNYDVMRRAAEARFCTYDFDALAQKPGVTATETGLQTRFFGKTVAVDRKTGTVSFPEEDRRGDFGETLTVLDWLCDRKEDATAAMEFCPVSSLPGVLVSGGNLVMNPSALAAKIDKNPEKFQKICQALGGQPVALGDFGFRLLAFPDLPMALKFYHSDEEFPASLTLLWDRNTLQFIRYETVYYMAGCLQRYASLQ